MEEKKGLTPVEHLGKGKASLWLLLGNLSTAALMSLGQTIYGKLKIPSKYDTLMIVLSVIFVNCDVFVLLTIGLRRKLTKPLKMSCGKKLLVDLWLVLVASGIGYFTRGDELYFSLFQGCGVPLHLMKTINYWGGFENFGILDGLQAASINVAVSLSCRHPKWAPLLVTLVSLALRFGKKFSQTPPPPPPPSSVVELC
ncbi:auxin response factor 11 [Striga asiatica]|uniref:Auxin response factor 11 n=1 Tax=Striga asiatica TaxID=4170 RepID=A0A5A7QG39_STRAF|nr:auxin response factor 11 [Striga asiatica]